MATPKYPAEFVSYVCEVLVEIQKTAAEGELTDRGICSAALIASRDLAHRKGDWTFHDFNRERGITWLERTFRTWPHHSGNRDYPVPAISNIPEDAHTAYNVHHDKWDTRTFYGRARWDLLAHLLTAASKMKVR